MLYTVIISLILAFSVTLPLILTPITLGINIFCIASLAAITVTLYFSPWFGLTLFIIYVGGLLVIFSYFIATSPNQKIKIIYPIILISIIFVIALYNSDYNAISFLPALFIESRTINNQYAILYSPNYILITITLALLLLLALIFVVKISNRKDGPLRPFIYVPTYTKIPSLN